MGSIGIWQVILVLAIVLIIFGAGKLPRVMGDVAKGMKNFKQGMKDEDETDTAGNRQINREETVDTTASNTTSTSQNKDEAKDRLIGSSPAPCGGRIAADVSAWPRRTGRERSSAEGAPSSPRRSCRIGRPRDKRAECSTSVGRNSSSSWSSPWW